MSHVKGVETRASGRMRLGSVSHILIFIRKAEFSTISPEQYFEIEDGRVYLIPGTIPLCLAPNENCG
jgi:hypothetical protein